MNKKVYKQLEGQLVYVAWASAPDEDVEQPGEYWHLFKVLYTDRQIVVIQGVAHNGSKYKGGPLWVNWCQIAYIQPIYYDEDWHIQFNVATQKANEGRVKAKSAAEDVNVLLEKIKRSQCKGRG